MRRFLPREHGLIAWVTLPLLAAVVEAPRALPAALAVLAGFGAFNAARRGERRAGLGALALGAALALLALLQSPEPWALVLTLGLASLGAVLALAGLGGRATHAPALEVGALAGLGALGVGVALSAGGQLERTLTVALMLLAWQVTGLWWVRRSMAAVLPRRAPWREGLGVALLLAGSAVAAGCWYGMLAIPAVLLLYPLRMALHSGPRGPQDAARIGLTELGWSVLAVALATLAGGPS